MTKLSTKITLADLQSKTLQIKQKVLDLGLPQLGQSFKELDGQACKNALVAYRFAKKLEPIVEANNNTRADLSVQAMLSYDDSGLVEFNPARMSLDPFVRQTLYKSRQRLHECLSTFRLDYQSFSFPSGESFDSTKGDVSVLRKLRDKNMWKVTPDCADLFIKIVYHNRWLKRSAQAHIDAHPFYQKHRKRINSYLYGKYGTSKTKGLDIFSVKMKQFVLTLWYGSKITTVPKNVDVDRVIEIEVMGNMIVQRCIAHALIKCMNAYYSIDLLNAQWLHKTLIADLENATIDWSNASNSNWLKVVNWFFPQKVYKHLFAARSSVVSYRGNFHGLNMISPMGNGFTFEVMTCFLLAIARELDNAAMVFGDDVIIHRDVAESYIETVKSCGWIPNMKKTFIDGPFRESCGGFYHSDVGYITSFEFELPENAYDAMIFANKLFLVIPTVDGPLKSLLCDLWNHYILFSDASALRWQLPVPRMSSLPRKKLVYRGGCVPVHACGSRVQFLQAVTPSHALFNPELDKGIFVSKSMWKKRTLMCETSLLLHKATERQRRAVADKLQYKHHSVQIISIPTLVERTYKSNPVKDVKSIFWQAYYFRNGRTMLPVIRGYAECINKSYMIVDGALMNPLES